MKASGGIAAGSVVLAAGTSMDALIWALNHALISPSTVVFLVLVFPETKYIPSPLGMLPISQVNTVQKEGYMAKRIDYVQKFKCLCDASQIQVDTVLIESDMEAQAILELIPVLNIRKPVLGATKSSLRRLRSKKGNGVTVRLRSYAKGRKCLNSVSPLLPLHGQLTLLQILPWMDSPAVVQKEVLVDVLVY